MEPYFFSFVAFACLVALFVDTPATRCALGLAALHLVATGAGLMTTNWLILSLLNLAGMFVVVWRPAGSFQLFMGGLFIAGAVKHLAFGLSNQTNSAEWVAWKVGVAIALLQALALLLYSGGRLLVTRTRLWSAIRSRSVVRSPMAANR